MSLKHPFNQAGHATPASTLASQSHSVADVSADRIQSFLPTSQHALGFHHGPVMLTNQGGQGERACTSKSDVLTDAAQVGQPVSNQGQHRFAVPPLSNCLQEVAASDTASGVTCLTRGQLMPASITNQSSLYAPPIAPVHMLSSSAAVQLADKSASLSRRASLAAKLQQMAANADSRNIRVSDSDSQSPNAAPFECNGYAHKTVKSTAFGPESGVPYRAMSPPKARTSLGKVRTIEHELSPDQSAQQTTAAVDSQAAGVRRQHLSTIQAASNPEHCLIPASPLNTDSTNASDTGNDIGDSQANHAGHTPKRTLSDAALEALHAVQSMQCPIIQYNQLQIHRKIGDGSIGQVCM